MEHINIILKEAITRPNFWLPLIVTAIAVLGLIVALIHYTYIKNEDIMIRFFIYLALVA